MASRRDSVSGSVCAAAAASVAIRFQRTTASTDSFAVCACVKPDSINSEAETTVRDTLRYIIILLQMSKPVIHMKPELQLASFSQPSTRCVEFQLRTRIVLHD